MLRYLRGPLFPIFAALLCVAPIVTVSSQRRAAAGSGGKITLALLVPAKDQFPARSVSAAMQIAIGKAPSEGLLSAGAQVRVLETGTTRDALKSALRATKAAKPKAVFYFADRDRHEAIWKAARSLKVPWFGLSGASPDSERNPGRVLHVAPTEVWQAVWAADALLAPLAARSVGVVHEETTWGRRTASAFMRSVSGWIRRGGISTWAATSDEATAEERLAPLRAMEAEWLYVSLSSEPLRNFLQVLEASEWRPKLLLAAPARDESLLAVAPEALSNAAIVGGIDPELSGRVGEALIDAMDRREIPLDDAAIRAFEATRRFLSAYANTRKGRIKHVLEGVAGFAKKPSVLGRVGFAHHGSLEHPPLMLWRVHRGRVEPWPEEFRLVKGCGPPLGFGVPPIPPVRERGKIGYLTYGEGEKRTIEKDLFELGLSTNGKHKDIDAFVRKEVLARAIRIAHQLFRREPDGTPIPGWSWGISLTATQPPKDTPQSKIWLAIIAGDHENAGGQAFGTWVSVYSTFLKRTMYISRALKPPLSKSDLELINGTYRWGEHRGKNARADKIRCLIDGFASAVGLTLAHEYGHLCGCGHDTEHPTSIMNVVAGAGASWEEAVWIPRHQRLVAKTLGIESQPEDD